MNPISLWVRQRWSVLRARNERGDAAISWLWIFPITLLLLLAVWQAVLTYQARSIALNAASEGARYAAAYNSTDSVGTTTAAEVVSNSNAGLRNTQISVARDTTAVTVTVTVTPVALLPGIDIPVTQSASVPIERLS